MLIIYFDTIASNVHHNQGGNTIASGHMQYYYWAPLDCLGNTIGLKIGGNSIVFKIHSGKS